MNVPARIAKNATSLAVAEIVIQGLAFLPAIYISRELGVVPYGKYILAVTFAGLFAPVAEIGLRQVIVREIAKAHQETSNIATNALLLRLFSSTASWILTMIAAFVIEYPRDVVLFIGLVATMTSIEAINDVWRAVFHGFERMEYDAITRVGGKVIAVGLGLTLMLLGYGVLGIMIALPLAAFVILIVSLWLMTRHFGAISFDRINAAMCRHLLRASIPLAIAGVFAALHLRFDTLLLSVLTDERTVGIYGAAYTLIVTLKMVPFFFNRAIYPVLSRRSLLDKVLLRETIQRSLKYISLVAFPISVGIFLSADRIVTLIYGNEFTDSGIILAWLSFALFFAFISTFYGNVIVAIDRQRTIMVVAFVGVVVSVGLNLALIPNWGAKGAAVAAVCVEVVVFLFYSWVLSRFVGPLQLHRLIVRPGLAALLMGAVLYMIASWNLFVTIAVAVAVYGLSVLLFRAVTFEDWKLIRSIFVSRVGKSI